MAKRLKKFAVISTQRQHLNCKRKDSSRDLLYHTRPPPFYSLWFFFSVERSFFFFFFFFLFFFSFKQLGYNAQRDSRVCWTNVEETGEPVILDYLFYIVLKLAFPPSSKFSLHRNMDRETTHQSSLWKRRSNLHPKVNCFSFLFFWEAPDQFTEGTVSACYKTLKRITSVDLKQFV